MLKDRKPLWPKCLITLLCFTRCKLPMSDIIFQNLHCTSNQCNLVSLTFFYQRAKEVIFSWEHILSSTHQCHVADITCEYYREISRACHDYQMILSNTWISSNEINFWKLKQFCIFFQIMRTAANMKIALILTLRQHWHV